MRYGIISDVHGNLEALDSTLAALTGESIDAILVGGDLVGYGADPGPCLAKIKALCLGVVAGNHDWAAVGLFPLRLFNALAARAVEWTRAQLTAEEVFYLRNLPLVYENADLSLAHANLVRPKKFEYLFVGEEIAANFACQKRQLCFIGHTHVPEIFVEQRGQFSSEPWNEPLSVRMGNKYIINVGSVGQPRDGDPAAAYCLFDTEKKQVAIKRVAYDVRKTQRKMRRAGLPPFLSSRLAEGV